MLHKNCPTEVACVNTSNGPQYACLITENMLAITKIPKVEIL